MTPPTEGGDVGTCPMCGDSFVGHTIKTCVRRLLIEAWVSGHEASSESDTWEQVQAKAAHYAETRLDR